MEIGNRVKFIANGFCGVITEINTIHCGDSVENSYSVLLDDGRTFHRDEEELQIIAPMRFKIIKSHRFNNLTMDIARNIAEREEAEKLCDLLNTYALPHCIYDVVEAEQERAITALIIFICRLAGDDMEADFISFNSTKGL